jgi:hypothetical protein
VVARENGKRPAGGIFRRSFQQPRRTLTSSGSQGEQATLGFFRQVRMRVGSGEGLRARLTSVGRQADRVAPGIRNFLIAPWEPSKASKDLDPVGVKDD